MKRILLGAAVLLLATAGFANADPMNSAVAHVYVDVDPNIAVMALDPYVDMGSIQTGEFEGEIPFRVDANTEQVRLSAGASHLFKGNVPGDPDSVLVDPIMLCTDPEKYGIFITAELANPIEGADNFAAFTQPLDIDGFPGMGTDDITFESAQPGHFSQGVSLTVCWDQDDPEKPMGEYSGAVELFAWVVLP